MASRTGTKGKAAKEVKTTDPKFNRSAAPFMGEGEGENQIEHPVGEIQNEINNLGIYLGHLFEEIELLEERLGPVLDRTADDGPSLKNAAPEMYSELGNKLNMLNDKVETMTSHLNNIRGRIVV